MRNVIFAATLLFTAASAQAGVIINGTRLVFEGDKKEASLEISNSDPINYLVQSWVDNLDNQGKAPFLVTPPLFRFDAHQNNALRVIHTNGALPQDHESMYWLNIKTIPSVKHESSVNTLNIAVKTRIKLIYRPAAVEGKPEEQAQQLSWHRSGNQLVVHNPTPFYMNFKSVMLDGKKLPRVAWAAPQSDTRYALPADAHGNSISWSVITDYGSISHNWQKALN